MNYYQIADAAKKVNVESHVLRYWEEELQLPIERNKQGHRLYTDEDLSRFLYIKELKKEGLQLRAIRTKVHMREEQLGNQGPVQESSAGKWDEKQAHRPSTGKWDGKQEHKPSAGKWDEEQAHKPSTVGNWNQQQTAEAAAGRTGDEKQLPKCKDSVENAAQIEEEKTRKAARLCMMLQQMVVTAVHEENEGLLREIKKGVAETVSKEMNYQFSMQEQREEEHYKKLDEILRERERRNRMTLTDRKRMKKERQRAEKEKQRAEKENARREKEMLLKEQEDARREKEKLKQEQEDARKKREKAKQESARREKERLKQEKENARREKEKVRQMKAREEKEKKQTKNSLFGTREKNGQEQRA